MEGNVTSVDFIIDTDKHFIFISLMKVLFGTLEYFEKLVESVKLKLRKNPPWCEQLDTKNGLKFKTIL